MHTAMPVGIDDFAEARKKYYLVDKTAFIGKLVQHPAQVTLFTRPRRFGKTMLMSMLRYFFDIEGAEEHRRLFDGLAVSQDAATMQLQGSRPVLFLTLKGWKYPSWERMQSGVQRQLSKIFRQYSYLMDGDMTPWDKEDFLTLVRCQADIDLCQDALAFLLRLLEEHYGKKPVLLLDEYDVPIQTAWTHHYYDEAISFFREFLSGALKSNDNLDFAVLTGVLRIAKESIFSDLNNLKVDSLVHVQYPEAFGFTSDEVAQMAADLGKTDKLTELQDWYDGYRLKGQEIYNPWSVLNYFDRDCQPEPYWVNTSGNAILQGMLQHASEETLQAMQGVLQGHSITALLREGVIYSEIYANRNALYTMLLTTGYLTCAQSERTDLGTRAQLGIPNREILALFRWEVLERYQLDNLPTDVQELLQALLQGDVATVQRGLGEYLAVLTSMFDVAKGKESFYHGFVLGLTAILVPQYEVQSNRESGYGRYDIAVFPKQAGKPGLVLEFKTAETEDELPTKAQEALQQIVARDYTATFRARDVQMVYHYGIAFCGKKVQVAIAREE